MLHESFALCRQLTRHHAKSFYFASHALPRAKREAAYALYAYCREVDDQVDLAPTREAKQEALQNLRVLTREILAGPTPDLSHARGWVPAFYETVRHRHIPERYFEELLTGVEMDLGKVRMQTWDELERYSYHVASVVGLMMTHVLTDPGPEHLEPAKDLGTAMQLTNILRDIQEDLEQDRIYLPEEDLRKFGVTEDDLKLGRINESFRGLMRFEIGRARAYYDRAEQGIRKLPSDGSQWCVWMMREIYAGILVEIERRDYQVFSGRARVGAARKMVLALKAWRRARAFGK
jgi:phytoene synthase